MTYEYKQYLAHHGIKGQKWGVRRYQNEDGSLTEEGLKRYQKNNIKELKRISKQTLFAPNSETTYTSVRAKHLFDDKFTDDEKKTYIKNIKESTKIAKKIKRDTLKDMGLKDIHDDEGDRADEYYDKFQKHRLYTSLLAKTDSNNAMIDKKVKDMFGKYADKSVYSMKIKGSFAYKTKAKFILRDAARLSLDEIYVNSFLKNKKR